MNYLILLLILLLTTPCFAEDQLARMSIGVMGGAVATAAGCTTANDSALFDKTGLTGINDPQSAPWLGTKITLSATTTLTEYHSVTCGNATKTYSMELWTDDGGSPSKPLAVISGSSISKSIASCGSRADETFTLATPKTGVTSASYWIMLKVDQGGTYNSLDYGADTGGRICTSSDGAAFTCYANYSFKVSLLGCQ